jgi:hypothetical protein
MRALPTIAPAALLLLTACGARDNEPAPGGVTVGEARALDDAATMLEARRGEPPAMPSSPLPQPAPGGAHSQAH